MRLWFDKTPAGKAEDRQLTVRPAGPAQAAATGARAVSLVEGTVFSARVAGVRNGLFLLDLMDGGSLSARSDKELPPGSTVRLEVVSQPAKGKAAAVRLLDVMDPTSVARAKVAREALALRGKAFKLASILQKDGVGKGVPAGSREQGHGIGAGVPQDGAVKGSSYISEPRGQLMRSFVSLPARPSALDVAESAAMLGSKLSAQVEGRTENRLVDLLGRLFLSPGGSGARQATGEGETASESTGALRKVGPGGQERSAGQSSVTKMAIAMESVRVGTSPKAGVSAPVDKMVPSTAAGSMNKGDSVQSGGADKGVSSGQKALFEPLPTGSRQGNQAGSGADRGGGKIPGPDTRPTAGEERGQILSGRGVSREAEVGNLRPGEPRPPSNLELSQNRVSPVDRSLSGTSKEALKVVVEPAGVVSTKGGASSDAPAEFSRQSEASVQIEGGRAAPRDGLGREGFRVDASSMRDRVPKGSDQVEMGRDVRPSGDQGRVETGSQGVATHGAPETAARQVLSFIEATHHLQALARDELGIALMIFPLFLKDGTGVGNWAFWKDGEGSQSESSGEVVSHIAFDLTMSNLGLVRIHVIKQGDEIGLSVGTSKEFLPLVRRRLSDLVEGLKGLGFVFSSIELFAVEEVGADDILSGASEGGAKASGTLDVVA